MDNQTAVTALTALAQSSRLAVFRHLVEQGRTGASPSEISVHLDYPGATLSFHLKSLQQAGLIGAEKTGRSIRYRVDFAAMQSLLDYLTENCCAVDATACAPGCTPPSKATGKRKTSTPRPRPRLKQTRAPTRKRSSP